MTALCGALLPVDQIETVTPADGMPCTLCVLLRCSSTPRLPAVGPAAASQSAGQGGQPVVAGGCYLSWGWPVMLRGDQVLLTPMPRSTG